jgi:uncharacterized membrane protein YidH (DUF202 family)
MEQLIGFQQTPTTGYHYCGCEHCPRYLADWAEATTLVHRRRADALERTSFAWLVTKIAMIAITCLLLPLVVAVARHPGHWIQAALVLATACVTAILVVVAHDMQDIVGGQARYQRESAVDAERVLQRILTIPYAYRQVKLTESDYPSPWMKATSDEWNQALCRLTPRSADMCSKYRRIHHV